MRFRWPADRFRAWLRASRVAARPHDPARRAPETTNGHPGGRPFDVMAHAYRATLDEHRAAEFVFSVTNTSPVSAKRGRARIVSSDGDVADWVRIEEPERQFAPRALHKYRAEVAVPPTTPAGEYTFQLVVVDVSDPDESYTESAAVAFEAPAPGVTPPKPKKPFPWWIPALVGGLLVLGLVAFFLWPEGDPPPLPPASPPAVGAETIIDRAMQRITLDPASWRTALSAAIEEMTADEHASPKERLSTLLNRADASQSVCSADFVGTQVNAELAGVRAEVVGTEPVPPHPAICRVSPSQVDMTLPAEERAVVNVYGYSFDVGDPFRALLTDNNRLTDVSQHLSRETPFRLGLDLGASGVRLTSLSQKLGLRWNGEEMAVILMRPQPQACATTSASLSVPDKVLVPPKVAGDAEFYAHGPAVSTSVALLNLSTRLDVRIAMTATETGGGDTVASGSDTIPIYTPPSGSQILRVDIGRLTDFFQYTDTNHSNDVFDRGSGGPVSRYVFVGDTYGDEAGTRTKVTVTFNRLPITLIQKQDCLPS